MDSLILMLLVVFIAGGIGGVINALMTENGFPMPKKKSIEGTVTIIRPGIIGNVLIGGAGATISWGLYGPLSSTILISTSPTKILPNIDSGLSLAALVGAMLIGISGAKWLTNEVDKSLLKAAAIRAAGAIPSSSAAQEIAMASPSQALELARSMQKST